MSRSLIILAVAILGASLPASGVQAEEGKLLTHEEFETYAQEWEDHAVRVRRVKAYRAKLEAYYRKRGWRPPRGPSDAAVGVPELDGRSAQGALVLVAGGLLVVTARRRRLGR